MHRWSRVCIYSQISVEPKTSLLKAPNDMQNQSARESRTDLSLQSTRRLRQTNRGAILVAAVALFFSGVAHGQYEATTAYYSGITTQTGSALKNQLASIMSSGHVQSSYAEARDFLPFTDANPDNLTQMFEFYGRAVIQKPSATHVGFTGVYESREHVWPDSLQGPGNTSNSTRGSRGDIHMLKPLRQSTNSSRGNNAFGGAALSGSARNIGGSQWFPSDLDKGDAARIIFYGATRYQSTLSVVNGNPATNTQMGDLNALLRFHYLDTPDLFEQRRNDTIYRGDDVRTAGDDSSFSGTRNRNAYIDRPEYAWSVFADQQNDSRLSVGTPGADGSSALHLDMGRVLRNAPLPASQNVTLSKMGVDGTYYSVTSAGAATSTVNGRYNAFAMDSAGLRVLGVGINASTAVAGLKSGAVTIDNLDVTTGGGTGRGANDGDDVITTTLSVLDASNASFAGTADTNTLMLNFGSIVEGSGAVSLPFSIYNLSGFLGDSLTARLDLDSITASGDAGAFSLNASPFTNLSAGSSRSFNAMFDPSAAGSFAAAFTFRFSDENLPGTVSSSQLTLNVVGSVLAPIEVYEYDIDADGNYSHAANFTNNTVPTGEHGRVRFGSVITAARTVTVDLDVTLTSLAFDNVKPYTLAGSHLIQIVDTGTMPAVRVHEGSHVISAPMNLGTSTRFDVATDSSLSLRGTIESGAALIKEGGGRLEIPSASFTSLEVQSGMLTLRDSTATTTKQVSIEAGALVDIAQSILTVDYDGQTSPLGTLKTRLLDGGLTSSALGQSGAIGYLDALSLGLNSYGGIALDGTAIVLRATLKGDANLDLAVDFDDLLILAQHYGGTGSEWFEGDFDYDGHVNFDDLLALSQSYGAASPSDLSLLQTLNVTLARDWMLARALTPEPGALLLIAIAGLSCSRRARQSE